MPHEQNLKSKSLPVVLVVDDDPTSGLIISATLRGSFEVLVETSGASALSRAIEVKPQIVLLDLHMPNVDGYEVLSRIRENPVTATIPVLCMSGDKRDESRKRTKDLGAIGHLNKPLDPKVLLKDLQSLLSLINTSMESANTKRSFFIGFNEAEKTRVLKERLKLSLKQNSHPIAVISFQDGESFCDWVLKDAVEQGKLYYFQMLPSLITKFPYLQDLSPIMEDLKEFWAGGVKPETLYFDDVTSLFDLNRSTAAIARFFYLKDALTGTFDDIKLFCSRDGKSSNVTALNEIGTVFCK